MPMGTALYLPGLRCLRVIGAAVSAGLSRRPSGMTLELLRSQLSHEVAAKVARLSGLVAEWRTGRYDPRDPADAALLIEDLEAIVKAHAGLAAARIATFWTLLRVQRSLDGLRSALGPTRKGKALSIHDLDRFTRRLEQLQARTRLLVDDLSSLHGVRLTAVVNAATDEIRREIGGGLVQGSVSIVLDETVGGPPVWIPSAEIPHWHDLFKNLIRNAVEATEEQRRRSDLSSDALPAGSPRVRVRITADSMRAGQLVEIQDEGVGIAEEDLERIWHQGVGRHETGRGQGLTESKREFLRAHGTYEIRSLPGVGTTVRIEVPLRPIDAVVPAPWRLRVLVVPGVAALVLALFLAFFPRARLHRVQVEGASCVAGLALSGEKIWETDLGDVIVRNYLYGAKVDSLAVSLRNPVGIFTDGPCPLPLRDRQGRITRLAVATQPSDGPGSLWFLDPRGRVIRRIVLAWQAPTQENLGKLMGMWLTGVAWEGRSDGALALQIRDSNNSPSSVRFLTWSGETLGEYYHWGQLHYRAAGDFDRDGRTEVLLCGINNYAGGDTTIFPRDPGVYIDCIVLLEVPDVSGQSYPYRHWPGMPAADEEGYLLIPPLREGVRPQIYILEIVSGTTDGDSVIEARLLDGRIYRLDGRLRPLSCRTGDFSPASRADASAPIGPLVYIHRGQRSELRVPIEVTP